MSYYYPYYTYPINLFSYLSSLEAESALRRSRVAAELAASRVAA